ncbi:hypothetical protein AKUH4B202J_04410 [Apilactobacillus kunkeei]|nr:hypothetical protein AKUH4B202J_04410 [Apilactobacillus kunkeei]
MPNDEEIKPSSYKEYLSYLVFYNGDLTDTLINDLEEHFELYYAYDIKDSKEELDTDDFQTVYKKVSDGKYEEISDKEYKKAAFKIYDIIPGCIYDWMVDFFFYENDNVEESNQTLLNNFPEIKEAHTERAWYSETYNTIREHQLFDMKDFPKL